MRYWRYKNEGPLFTELQEKGRHVTMWHMPCAITTCTGGCGPLKEMDVAQLSAFSEHFNREIICY